MVLRHFNPFGGLSCIFFMRQHEIIFSAWKNQKKEKLQLSGVEL